MKHRLFIIALSLLCIACGRDKAVVKIDLNDASNKDIILSQLHVNKIVVIDTMKTDGSGYAKYKIRLADKSPNFYYLSYNRKRLASLIVCPGDKITVKCDTLGNNLEIIGSEESILLKEIDSTFTGTMDKFEQLANDLAAATSSGNTELSQKIKYDLGALYVKQKRAAIKSIMLHPYSFTNISLLYQKFSDKLPVFADLNDGLFFKRVRDSIAPVYPESVYINMLDREVANFENSVKLQQQFSQAQEVAFPNIQAPDINSKIRNLTDFNGKPFILIFWTTGQVAQKMFNLDLLEIYNKYHSKGLEIYSVCIDSDKTAWATTIKDQKLPWVNVCDGQGTASQSIAIYNITKLPALFVYDAAGNSRGKNIFDKNKLDSVVAGLF